MANEDELRVEAEKELTKEDETKKKNAIEATRKLLIHQKQKGKAKQQTKKQVVKSTAKGKTVEAKKSTVAAKSKSVPKPVEKKQPVQSIIQVDSSSHVEDVV